MAVMQDDAGIVLTVAVDCELVPIRLATDDCFSSPLRSPFSRRSDVPSFSLSHSLDASILGDGEQ